MANLKKPPYRFTQKQDKTILQLFNWVSTEKLSILMRVSSQRIIDRYNHLTNGGK